MARETILIIEDDSDLREGLHFSFVGDGYEVLDAGTKRQGLYEIKKGVCDLVLLDCNLPDGTGFELCKEIRSFSKVPVIMLTARDTEMDEIKALELGVDDYLSKPFSLGVLKARIKRLLDRKTEPAKFVSGDLAIDKDMCRVYKNGEEIVLSRQEYKLLLYLLENKNHVLSKEQILSRIWDNEGKFVDHNTVSVNISRLRTKVENNASDPKYIKTIHGIGYMRIGGTLLIELWLLFLIGYPSGCLMGNGILRLFFQKLNHVFEAGAANIVLTGNELTGMDQVSAGKAAGTAVFCVSWTAVFVGFGLLLTALAGVAFFTVRSLRRQSLSQAMRGDTSFIRKKRRIYSIRSFHLVHVLIRKFMFSNKKRVIGIILSLPVGGCIFLCTSYMAENMKIHADMSMKSDDGLGSEYRVSVKSSRLSDTIPSETVEEIKKIPELSQVYATKVILGELTVREEEMDWPEYFDEQNEDSYFQQVFDGICATATVAFFRRLW